MGSEKLQTKRAVPRTSKKYYIVPCACLVLLVLAWLSILSEKQAIKLQEANVKITDLQYQLAQQKKHFESTLKHSEGLIDSAIQDASQAQAAQRGQKLDFFIMGFPKCATSSLLYLFKDNLNETTIITNTVNNVTLTEYAFNGVNAAKRLLKKIKDESVSHPGVELFGIKWPTAIERGIGSLRDLIDVDSRNEETKIIVGMRHPVRFFESFYNFRLLYHDMPPADSLIGGIEAQVGQLYTGMAQFEKFIAQLGKVDLDSEDLKSLGENRNVVLSTPNKVFIYSQEQFLDENRVRFDRFFKELQVFLGVKTRITADLMPRKNVGRSLKKFNICDEENSKVREVLVHNAKNTASWILTKLANATDVTIGGEEHFFQIVESWGKDPCLSD